MCQSVACLQQLCFEYLRIHHDSAVQGLRCINCKGPQHVHIVLNSATVCFGVVPLALWPINRRVCCTVCVVLRHAVPCRSWPPVRSASAVRCSPAGEPHPCRHQSSSNSSRKCRTPAEASETQQGVLRLGAATLVGQLRGALEGGKGRGGDAGAARVLQGPARAREAGKVSAGSYVWDHRRLNPLATWDSKQIVGMGAPTWTDECRHPASKPTGLLMHDDGWWLRWLLPC